MLDAQRRRPTFAKRQELGYDPKAEETGIAGIIGTVNIDEQVIG